MRFDRETDVVYAMILDRFGQVVAHSRAPGAVGSTLSDPVSLRALAAAPVLQETVGPDGEALYDIAVPILVEGDRWGTVRIALSRRRMDAEISGTRRELAALAVVALVLGGLATAIVARRITRPVRQLADGVAAIARGELDQRIDPGRSDELGRLALAFNEMAAQLRQQRTDLEVADAALRQRFAELSDLKSYTDHILRSFVNGLVTLDLDGRVVTVNPAAETLTGSRGERAHGPAGDGGVPPRPGAPGPAPRDAPDPRGRAAGRRSCCPAATGRRSRWRSPRRPSAGRRDRPSAWSPSSAT